MEPALVPDRLVIAATIFRKPRVGDTIIFKHDGLEKIKRLQKIENDKLFVVGDNLTASTDSRHFGWVDQKQVLGRIIWPKN